MGGFSRRGIVGGRARLRVTPVGVAVAVVAGTFLPVFGHAAAGALTTQPITPNGAAVTVTVGTAGPNNEVDLTFNGSPGQVFSIATSAGTFSNCDVEVSLVDPDGATVIAPACGGSSAFLDATAVDDLGQYFIRVAPVATATGSVKVNLYRSTDQTATLTSGTGVHASLSTPGQNLVGTFAGTAGQKLSVTVTSGLSCSENVELFAPDGTQLAISQVCGGNGFIDATTLPVTGSYRVVLDPQGALTDTTALLKVFTFTDQAATLTSGTGAHASLSTPGQNLVGTIAGTAGHKLSVTVTSGLNCSENVELFAPDATQLAISQVCGGNGFIDATTLPVTGSYRVVLDPQGALTDTTAVMTAFNVTDQTATLTAGTGVPASLATPGQNLVGTWAGTAGQKITASVTGGAGCSENIEVFAPDHTQLSIAQLCGGTGGTGIVMTPVTGSYQVVLDPQGTLTDTGAVMTLNLSAQDTSTATPTVVRANGSSSSSIVVTIRNSTGTAVSGDTVALTGNGSVNISPPTAVTNASGKATFTATDTVAETVTFTATDQTASIVADNPVVVFSGAAPSAPAMTAGVGSAVAISTGGQVFAGTFTGAVGQLVSVDLPNPSFNACYDINLVAPNGTTLSATRNCGGDSFVRPAHLPYAGKYTVELIVDGAGTGTGTLTYYTVTNQTPALSAGVGTAVNLTTPGQLFLGTFTGAVGQIASVDLPNPSFTACYDINLIAPNGATLSSTRNCGGDSFVRPARLPFAGTYTVELIADGAGTGTGTLTYYTVTNQTPALSAGVGTAVNLTTPGQLFLGTFTGASGQLVSVDMPNPSFTACYDVNLIDPTGTTLNSTRNCGTDSFIHRTHLPFAGTYTVELIADGAGTGTGTLTYYSITDQTAKLKLNKSTTVPVSLTTPGQIFTGTFSATAGNEISASVTAAAFNTCFDLDLVNPRGAVVASNRSCTNSTSLSFVGLTSSGKFSIAIVLDGNGTGSATFGSFTGLAISTLATPELNVPFTKALKVLPGTAPYSFALTGGALPTGLNLISGKIKGTPTVLGTFGFTIRVTDASFQTASTTYTLTVVNELLVTTSSLPNGTHNVAYNATLAGSGGTTPYTWSLTAGTVLPAGLVLDAATGSITGTPTTAGTTNFTVMLADKSVPKLTETRALSITIS